MAENPEKAEKPDKPDVEKAPPVVERFVRQLVVTNKAVQLYPAGSDITRQNAETALAAASDALAELSELTITITKQGLYFGEAPIFPNQPTFMNFSQECYNRRLALVRFHAGLTMNDLVGFLELLKLSPDDIVAAGGYEAMMWEHGVSTVTVVETQVTLIDQATDEMEGEHEAPTTQVQKRAPGPRTRERIEIARVVGNEEALRDYLTDRIDADGNKLTINAMQKRFSELALMASEQQGPTSDQFVRMFAKALWALEPGLRRQLLDQQMAEARNNTAVAGAIRRIDFQELMRMLADADEEFDAKRTGFTRALKNLVLITQTDRETVTKAATQVLSEQGASPSTIERVLADASPTHLTVRPMPSQVKTLDTTAAVVLQLIDHAPLAETVDGTEDPEVAALQAEAEGGIGEADIIAAYVALAGLDSGEAQFANTMSLLEDSLDQLVSRGEIGVAADAAIALVHAAKNPALTSGQTQRLENAITRFARAEDIRTITHTLRIYEPGQPEYDAAQRLIETLGVLAIRPMLEQLAEEQDRGERKALVDLISKDAAKYINELASHVGDERWFFVRNVVSILGSTKSPAVLPPLERPLRHSDTRVRREAIRALSGIHERKAVEMLTSALEDEDPHNVQLAARYLGMTKQKSAVPALEMVARGEGRGNRENGPRVEAIEALGRMAATEALPTLEVLARKRAIIGAARVRELRTAAQAAVAAIKATGGMPR